MSIGTFSKRFSIDSELSTDAPSEDDDPGDGYHSPHSKCSTIDWLSNLTVNGGSGKERLPESCILPCSVESNVSSKRGYESCSEQEEVDKVDVDSFPSEIKGGILECLDYEQVIQIQAVSRGWKALIQSPGFIQALSLKNPPKLTACYFFIENRVWQWAGIDPSRNRWRRMPPLGFLPPDCTPDEDLFKQFLICASKGLVAMNFSKSPHKERIIVFNPLTQEWRVLPPLLHRRNPVLMHMTVDELTQSYQILVAGSSSSGDEELSKITELYSSRTGRWERVDDLPGPAFALNEYQSGIYRNGTIYCIAFQERREQIVKGIWGFSLADRKWMAGVVIPSSAILHLVMSNGEMYLFSERENGRATEHCVDRILDDELVNVVKKNKSGGRSLEVYPESALVPFSDQQLCLYNTVDHTGDVFDVEDPQVREGLPALPEKGFRGELSSFCLNPMTFAIELRFNAKV